MPKQKTKKSAAKRLKTTGTGKLTHRHAFSSHNFEHKSAKRRRSFRKDQDIAPADVKVAKKLLGK